MNNFARTLSQLLKDKKIAVYSLAKSCAIERTYFSRILTGERNFPPEKLNILIKKLNLSAKEEQSLREIYIADVFGDVRYNKYLDFINKIGNLDIDDDADAFSPSIKISLETDKEIVSFSGPLDTANVVDFAIGNELRKQNSSSRIYTNLTTKILFPIIKKHTSYIPDSLDFKHIISINPGDEYTFDSMFEIVRFLTYGCFTMYYNSDTNPADTFDTLFPYFIITDEFLVFITGNLDGCHIVNNKTLADIHAQQFLLKAKSAKKYVTLFDDILACKESCKQIHSAGYDTIYTFGTFCATLHMTQDMWEQIAKPDIPSRDYLVKTTYEYYVNSFEAYKNKNYIYFKDSIDEFVNHGIVKNIPAEYAEPLTVKNRIRVLENFRKHIVKHDYDFLLVKDPEIEKLKNISIEAFTKSDNEKAKYLSFYSMINNSSMHYIGNINCNIDEPKTIEEFLRFVKYFSVSGACYTAEESLAVLDDAIERCKSMK